ncbi:DNA/RNA-binding protein KIN17-like isoform X2 [Anneissia japonica]|nr:DNA/RNA-binding protein KIN17-like isoform X2 [Anneissia japonica]XP_033106527.1 DNA/RNA-binding protein KIN17-like isoform X2 [Anneissia japonica]
MPKNGFLTPKAIANRIKAKGLQKLRWYCQMCQKQCRDENGFKCHTMSESHQRQLLLFAENPDKYLDYFSEEFLDGFMELLKRRFGTRRIHSNVIYNEYIQDRDHIHMTSTQWETLTDFVKWLGREGYVTVDHTEKGWFITYIDRDPEVLARQKLLEKREKIEEDDEERMQKFIQKQIEKASETEKNKNETVYTELKRDDEDDKITFNLGAKSSKDEGLKPGTSGEVKKEKAVTNALKAAESALSSKKNEKDDRKRKKSALEEIKEMEEKKKKTENPKKDYWLAKGIVVKVITKRLGEKYYKKKGVIKEVRDLYTGLVKMTDSGTTIKVDQMHVETVIPAEGKQVLVLNGIHRGCQATLLSLDSEKFCVSIRLESGSMKGRVVNGVQYEDISKLAQ